MSSLAQERHGADIAKQGAASAEPAPGHRPRLGGSTPRTTRDLPSLPAPIAATAPPQLLRSSDPRSDGRRVEDVSRALKAQLLELARDINRLVEGILREKHDLLAERNQDFLGGVTSAIAGPQANDPDHFDAILPAWEALLGTIVQDVHLPDDAAHVVALATRVIADVNKFSELGGRTSALWDALEDHAKREMAFWGDVVSVVKVVKDVSFAAAIVAATIYSGGLAATPLGAMGFGSLGGALVGGGLRAADVSDDHSLAARTAGGVAEGGLMGPTGEVGAAVGGAVRATGAQVLGDSVAARVVTESVAGGANMGVATSTYGTAASLAHGDDVGTAVRAGVTAAEYGAPFGAVLGVAGEALAANHEAPSVEPPKPLPSNPAEAKALRDAGLEYDGEEIRVHYLRLTESVEGLNARWLAEGKSAAERARLAYEIRHNARLTARAMDHRKAIVDSVRARDLAKFGSPDGPTFDWLVERARASGLEGDAVYEEIIGSSQRTDRATNAIMGVRGKDSRSGDVAPVADFARYVPEEK